MGIIDIPRMILGTRREQTPFEQGKTDTEEVIKRVKKSRSPIEYQKHLRWHLRLAKQSGNRDNIKSFETMIARNKPAYDKAWWQWFWIILILIICAVLGIIFASIWIICTLWALYITYNDPEYYEIEMTFPRFVKRFYDSITSWPYMIPMYYLYNRKRWRYKMILYHKREAEMKKFFDEEQKRIAKLREKKAIKRGRIL